MYLCVTSGKSSWSFGNVVSNAEASDGLNYLKLILLNGLFNNVHLHLQCMETLKKEW